MAQNAACSEMVVVANRLPVRAETVRGETHWVSSPGGLVAAVAPVAVDPPEEPFFPLTAEKSR